jgi:hypothetical protein
MLVCDKSRLCNNEGRAVFERGREEEGTTRRSLLIKVTGLATTKLIPLAQFSYLWSEARGPMYLHCMDLLG